MHDVFIAYHGTYDSKGTEKVAEQLARYFISKNLDVFFYPLSKSDAFKTNIFEVMNSKTFLLLCNENIHRTNKRIDHSIHYELSVEIDSFYSSTFLDNSKKSTLDSKILFCGEYNDNFRRGDEWDLHELFQNRVHLFLDNNNQELGFEETYEWIESRLKKDIATTYINRRVSAEIKQLYSKRSSLLSGENVNNLVAVSKRIICLGISNTDITSRIDQYALCDAIENGAFVEVFFLDPNGDGTQYREKEEEYTDERIKNQTYTNIQAAKSIGENLSEEGKKRFAIYMYDKIPRINLLIVDDCFFLQFYGYKSRGMDTPSFACEKVQTNSPLYDYCLHSYEFIKSISWRIEL